MSAGRYPVFNFADAEVCWDSGEEDAGGVRRLGFWCINSKADLERRGRFDFVVQALYSEPCAEDSVAGGYGTGVHVDETLDCFCEGGRIEGSSSVYGSRKGWRS